MNLLRIPWIAQRAEIRNKPKTSLYEILPSLSHDNKRIKTFVDSLATIFDMDRIFINSKEVVGLEIHANHERISYYFVIPDHYREYILSKIKHTFKGSAIIGEGVHKDSDDSQSGNQLRATHFVSSSHESDQSDLSRYHLVTLQLKEPSFLPLNMNENARMFEELTHTLDNLQEEEQVWVQMLFQPVNDEWQEEFREAYLHWLNGERNYKGIGIKEAFQLFLKGFLEALENMTRQVIRAKEEDRAKRSGIPDVNKKLSQPGFKTCIRVLVDAEEYRKAQIARGITAAFRTLAHTNDFVTRTPIFKQRTVKQMMERKMPRILMNGQILCSSEVANLMKIPDEKVDTPKLQRMTPEERRVSEKVTKQGIWMGNTVTKPPQPVYFSVSSLDDVARTRLIVASPGSGKSTLIEQFVHEAAKQGHGCAVFDVADGTLFERIILTNPEFQDRIIAIDYTDEEYPPAFNFSALGGDDATRGLMFAEFFEQLFKTEDLARTQSYMLKAALAVFSDPESTLLEFIEMLRNDDYRKKMLPKLRTRQPDLYLWWTREFPKVSEGRLREIISPILVRLDMLLYNTRMRNILCQKGGKLNPAEWMEKGNIVVFNLSGGSFTEPEQRILMSLHNAMFWNATLAREKLTRQGKEPRPFHLIYDEPQTYMGATPMFDRAISKARKYRVSCNFFIQEAEQIINQAPDLWKKILGMSPHLLVGPVSEFTAKQLSKELHMSVEEVLAIKSHKHCWIVRTFADKEAIEPFVMKSLPRREEREKIQTNHISKAKERSRRQYNILPKQELDKDINARSMGLSLAEYEKLLEAPAPEEPKSTAGTFTWGEEQ